MNILIIAAHPDDEVLGMGATIKKLSKTNNVSLLVVSEGASSQYDDKKMISVRHNACLKSSKFLGIKNVKFLDFPDMKLDTIPHVELNKKIEIIIQKLKPKIIYSPPENDLNLDHQLVFNSTLIASRPHTSSVESLYCYELPGLVKKPFNPNVYVNIEKEFESKTKAFKFYKSEVMNFPHPRSIKAIENLAIQRGIESGLKKAESFNLIKMIQN
tara:strand:- start:1276 stop:1917 length:642 start_codon:yes stop_codon:yes gene_type:complete